MGERDNLQTIHEVYEAFGQVHTFRLTGGKISTFEGYEDIAAVVAAFTAGPN